MAKGKEPREEGKNLSETRSLLHGGENRYGSYHPHQGNVYEAPQKGHEGDDVKAWQLQRAEQQWKISRAMIAADRAKKRRDEKFD